MFLLFRIRRFHLCSRISGIKWYFKLPIPILAHNWRYTTVYATRNSSKSLSTLPVMGISVLGALVCSFWLAQTSYRSSPLSLVQCLLETNMFEDKSHQSQPESNQWTSISCWCLCISPRLTQRSVKCLDDWTGLTLMKRSKY